MERIAVIGNAGGGKTTMCRKIGAALDIPVHPIDMIQWKAGWERATSEEFTAAHEAILAEDRWIIDGFGPMEAIAKRFALADTIIVIDYRLAIHYWWSMKRQIKCLFVPRDDLPDNCPMVPKTGELIRVMWMVHTVLRPQYLALAAQYEREKRVVVLHSPQEQKKMIQQIEQGQFT